MSADRIAAVILAGGRGERLGGLLKSEIRVGGARLLDRVSVVLVSCRPLVLAHGSHEAAALHPSAAMLPVADLVSDYAGPLAGFAAAVAAVRDQAELLVSVAVDTPFVPENYLVRLLAGLGGAPAGIAGYGGQPYPTNSIWRLTQIRDLPERVLAGTAPHSLKSLAAAVGAIAIEWAPEASGDPFANVNTPEELAAAEARAASMKGF